MSPAAAEAFEAGLNARLSFVLACLLDAMREQVPAFGDEPLEAKAALILALVDACTTAEARIGMAVACNAALDHDARLIKAAADDPKGPS